MNKPNKPLRRKGLIKNMIMLWPVLFPVIFVLYLYLAIGALCWRITAWLLDKTTDI